MERREVVKYLAIAGALCAAYGASIVAWQWDLWPRRVIMTRTVDGPDGNPLNVRHYWKSTRPFFNILDGRHSTTDKHRYPDKATWEVELPSGRWIDCGESDTDCLPAYEKAMR